MTKEELVNKLNEDLSNEYKHMLFYLQSSSTVQGLHRAEIGEYLEEHATSEMAHVKEFSKVIIGLGGRAEHNWVLNFPYLTNPREILEYALKMEKEVIANYVTRRQEAAELGGSDGTFVELFLEDQIIDSRKDADELKEMIKGIHAD